jgi:hypothetical protein
MSVKLNENRFHPNQPTNNPKALPAPKKVLDEGSPNVVPSLPSVPAPQEKVGLDPANSRKPTEVSAVPPVVPDDDGTPRKKIS